MSKACENDTLKDKESYEYHEIPPSRQKDIDDDDILVS